MNKNKQDHIRVESGTNRLFCTNCGKDYQGTFPCSIDMFVAMMRSFGKSHKNCKDKKPQKELK